METEIETRVSTFCRLLHEVSALCCRKEAQAVREADLTVAQYHALHKLMVGGEVDPHEPPLPLNCIADSLQITKGRLTRIVAELERKGLVLREKGHDRRQVLAKPTPAGLERFKKASLARARSAQALLKVFDQSQQQNLMESLAKLCALAEEEKNIET